jgi:branched-chain amino acid transport system substrate-binding protein|uniref:ABC transporter substrate-binding protein n=1 Tax=Desulfobacca acetoxidans TaxID=60893 RepID=A0A7C5EPZ0_9BACT
MQVRGLFRILAVAALCLALFLTGCAGEKPAYVVGGIFSITGPASYLGEPERNTLQMLVDEINAKGGIKGVPVKAVIYDDEGDVTKARLHAEKLVTKDQALAIIGPSLTHTSMTVLEITQKAKVPLISCAAGVGITAPAKERVWVFKTPQTDQMAVTRIYQYLKKQGLTKVAILTVSTGFGVSGKEQLEKQEAQFGMEIVAKEVFGEKDTDMTPQLTKIRGTPAQAVICWGTGPAPALVAKNMKQLGMTIPLIQSHGAASKKFIELAGDAGEGILMPAGKLAVFKQLPDTDPQKKVCQAYDEAYRKKFNAPASSFGGYAYDAMQMLAQALEKAGSDREKLREALESTKNYVGVSGIFNMSPEDHNGLTPEAFVMVKIEKGDFKLLE